ncbi:MAG: hypothetical protein K0Q63_2683, partial [Paenibacillus sp.]|nr:hypothetical protein [Paenibacillus sp.]
MIVRGTAHVGGLERFAKRFDALEPEKFGLERFARRFVAVEHEKFGLERFARRF